MPHDRNGDELKPGDVVTFRCEVKDVFPGEAACNANFQVLSDDGTGEYTPFFSCNTKLAEKVDLDVPGPAE